MNDTDFYARLIFLLSTLEVLPEAHFPLGAMRRTAIHQLLEESRERMGAAEEVEEGKRHAEWTRS